MTKKYEFPGSAATDRLIAISRALGTAKFQEVCDRASVVQTNSAPGTQSDEEAFIFSYIRQESEKVRQSGGIIDRTSWN